MGRSEPLHSQHCMTQRLRCRRRAIYVSNYWLPTHRKRRKCRTDQKLVSYLTHEVGDDPVESRVLEVQGLPSLADALLSCAEASEVLGSLRGGVSVQLHHDPPDTAAADADIEKYLGVRHFAAMSRAVSKRSKLARREL